MNSFFSSGSDAVDMMGQINISGNVIPRVWYQQIKTEKGKPHYLAVNILADIVYWYRPDEVRDEYTGNVIGWKKKFAGDMLQRGYDQLIKRFDEGKKTIQRSLETLESYGLIKRHFRTLEFDDGTILRNVMFIELIPEKVYELTYPPEDKVEKTDYSSAGQYWGRVVKIIEEKPNTDAESSETAEQNAANAEDISYFEQNFPQKQHKKGMDKNDQGYGQICPYPRTDLTTPPDRNVQPPGQMRPHPRTDLTSPLDSRVHTNTENTRENTTEKYSTHNPYSHNPIYPSNQGIDGMDGINVIPRGGERRVGSSAGNDSTADYMELIRKNIEYDRVMNGLCSEKYKQFYDEIFMVICDVVCIPRDKIRVGSENVPYALVKSRFLKLSLEHVEYVIRCMEKTTKNIANIRSYMITALYNAPTTMSHYQQAEDNHEEEMDRIAGMALL